MTIPKIKPHHIPACHTDSGTRKLYYVCEKNCPVVSCGFRRMHQHLPRKEHDNSP